MLTTISIQFPSGEWRFFTLDCIKETISKKSKLFIDSVNEIGINELKDKFGIRVANTEVRRWYDVFLSYRWAKGDSELVKGIFDSLTRYSLGEDSRLIHTFHDVSRLKDGQPLHESFSTGLINSSLVVCIVSKNALKKMEEHDPNQPDNVLVEWLLTSILFTPEVREANRDKMRIERVLPVLIDPGMNTFIQYLPHK